MTLLEKRGEGAGLGEVGADHHDAERNSNRLVSLRCAGAGTVGCARIQFLPWMNQLLEPPTLSGSLAFATPLSPLKFALPIPPSLLYPRADIME